MALPTNILQQVTTYNLSGLAYLRNTFGIIETANKKYNDFNKLSGNLGDSINYSLQSRALTENSLVVTNYGDTVQRRRTLTVDQQINSTAAFTAQERLFNFSEEAYMTEVGKSRMLTIGSKIERNIGLNFLKNSNRAFGLEDGTTDITSYQQLAQAIALNQDYGVPGDNMYGYIPLIKEPAILGSGLAEFTPSLNDVDRKQWQIADWNWTKWVRSNLLPKHTAGNVGQLQDTLTVTSFVTDGDGGISSITFSGATTLSDADAVKAYDLFTFQDGVGVLPDIRLMQFVEDGVSASKVQFTATADAVSDGGGNVTVAIAPKLYSAAGLDKNIDIAIAVGMQVTARPSHLVGAIVGGNALMCAMPRLPDQDPFATSSKTDEYSGISMRLAYGSKLGENFTGFIYDQIWGSDLSPDYVIRLCFKLP